MKLAIIIIIAGFVSGVAILIIDAIYAALTGRSKLWFRRHICDEGDCEIKEN